MGEFEFFICTSLEKVFPNVRPHKAEHEFSLSAIDDEIPAFQIVYYYEQGDDSDYPEPVFEISLEGIDAEARLRTVELIPSDFPAYSKVDDGYITTEAGMFPDMLMPVEDGQISMIQGQYRSVWVDFPGWGKQKAGSYDVKVNIKAVKDRMLDSGKPYKDDKADEKSFCLPLKIKKISTGIKVDKLYHTEWFYADCLADYYNVPVFSEKHWQIIESFIDFAALESGVTMLLTPVFTPALDTAVGGERTTTQLVDISYENGQYSFGFEKLEKWCAVCKKAGIKTLEIPPFFTQWGAEHAPKIMGEAGGEEKRLFGWETAAESPDYRNFLEAFIPALQNALHVFGYSRENVYYHISDEPEDLGKYMAARNQVADLLEGCNAIDALSSYAFYETGLVKEPVVANDSIEEFINKKTENLWVYYCCGQNIDVPNRYFSMPSHRCRIMGVLMYLHNIKGFLHWGFNFYNTRFSTRKINPFCTTHAGYAFPSGDAFLVYPGEDGSPVSSIRNENVRASIEDYIALKKLEKLKGRQYVEELICGKIGYKPNFKKYPRDAKYILNLREKVNSAFIG